MAQRNGSDVFAGKRCLLTGAASGIGRATALKLAAQGAELYLTDRDADGLEQTVADARALGGVVAEHRALDISDHDAVAAFAEHIHAGHPPMDIVMNIAGISAWGTVDTLSHQDWMSLIDINLKGPIHVIESFVPPMMKTRRGGHLVNVSSAAGIVALPWHAAYSASKYGLRGAPHWSIRSASPASIATTRGCRSGRRGSPGTRCPRRSPPTRSWPGWPRTAT